MAAHRHFTLGKIMSHRKDRSGNVIFPVAPDQLSTLVILTNGGRTGNHSLCRRLSTPSQGGSSACPRLLKREKRIVKSWRGGPPLSFLCGLARFLRTLSFSGSKSSSAALTNYAGERPGRTGRQGGRLAAGSLLEWRMFDIY